MRPAEKDGLLSIERRTRSRGKRRLSGTGAEVKQVIANEIRGRKDSRVAFSCFFCGGVKI